MVLGCSCCLLERKRKNICGFFGCFVVCSVVDLIRVLDNLLSDL